MIGPVVKFTAIVVAAAVLLTGCVFGPGAEPGAAAVDSRLYLGPIPEPSPLPAIGATPIAPTPPADFNDQAAMDEYIAAIEKYAEDMQNGSDGQAGRMAFTEAVHTLVETARRGGAASVAAWQSLLVTAGIAVAGPDGTPLELDGKTGAGWPVTDPELRLLALMGTSRDGIRLVDLAEVLKSLPELADTDVAANLYEDLQESATADFAFSTVLWALNPDFLFRDHEVVPKEDVLLNWGQIGLILRKLSVALVARATQEVAEPSARSGVRMQQASFTVAGTAANPSADKQACDISSGNPWVDELVKLMYKGHAAGFDKTLDPYLSQATQRIMTIARLVLAFVAVVAKMLALEAEFDMPNAPLVRTKKTQPGEVRDLTLTFNFNSGRWTEIAGCLNLLLAFTGFEIPMAPKGPVKDVSLDLKSTRPGLVRIGDGQGGTTPVTRGKTDSSGRAKFKLSGAPQRDFIPEQAEPDEKKVTLVAESNLESNDLFADLMAFPWAAMDAVGTYGLSLIPSFLSKLKILTHIGTVDVRDWKLEADFEVTAIGSMTLHDSWLRESSGCGPTTVTSGSVDAGVSFASDPVEVSAVLVSNPRGNVGDQAVAFVPKGEDFIPRDLGNGLTMFDLPVEYRADKTHSKPGTGKLPPKLVYPPSSSCADGKPGAGRPTSDCGIRDYAGVLEVSVPTSRKLHLTGDRQNKDLWQHCGPDFGVGDPPTAPGVTSCASPKLTGGQFPSIDEVYDVALRKFTVSGTMSCDSVETGFLRELEYEWTMVFCRIVEGEPAC